MSDLLLHSDQSHTAPSDADAAGAPTDDGPDVSVVVPLYNEAECVERLLQSLEMLETLLLGDYRPEFVLVDDGSRDDTVARIEAATADRPQYRVVQHGTNRGIAAAIETGLKAGRAPLAASIDADGSYDTALLAEMLPLTSAETPLVTASPYHPMGEVVGVPRWRVAISRAASRVYARLMPQRLDCYTACFRTYDRRAAVACTPTNPGFTGVAELAWRMQRRGGAVAEFPAVLRPRTAGVSKMRVGKTALAHARLMLRIAATRLIDSLKPPVDKTPGRDR